MNYSLKKICGYALGILLIGLMIWGAFVSSAGKSNNHHKNDVYPEDKIEKEYEPNKLHLYSLFLEEMEDTVIINDTTAIVLKVMVTDTLRFKKK